MSSWQEQLQERLDKNRAAFVRGQIQVVGDTFRRVVAEAKEEEMQKAVAQLALFAGVDPVIAQEALKEGKPGAVYRRRKDFGYENLNDCYQDACSAAGGLWNEDGDLGPGCYPPPGATVAEAIAVDLAYFYGTQECYYSQVGGLVKSIFDLVF